MLTGLDILLARMKTNPEEFLKEAGHVPDEGEIVRIPRVSKFRFVYYLREVHP